MILAHLRTNGTPVCFTWTAVVKVPCSSYMTFGTFGTLQNHLLQNTLLPISQTATHVTSEISRKCQKQK